MLQIITANFVFYSFGVAYIHACKKKIETTILENDTLSSQNERLQFSLC